MQRTVNAACPIHELLAKRWSPRSFSDRAVNPDALRALMEAARWAPSASNEQPWGFIVATKDEPEDYQKLLACLVERNQEWAKTAPVLMITVANRHFRKNGSPNHHALYDLGQAVAYMTMQATAMDLYMHQMAGFSAEAARTSFAIPQSAEAVSAIALGYLGAPEQLSESFRARELTPSGRAPISDFVFAGRFGQVAPWVAV